MKFPHCEMVTNPSKKVDFENPTDLLPNFGVETLSDKVGNTDKMS